jgi:hypothetical protein
MLPEKAALILSWMVVRIKDSPCCCIVEEAKMSMLRWRRSHQKGADDAGDDEEVQTVVIDQSIDAWRFRNDALLRPVKK